MLTHGRSGQRWAAVLLLLSVAALVWTRSASPQGALDVGSPVAPNGTTATFVGIEPANLYDSVNLGKLGAVWASMPGPYDTPIGCRCGTLAMPVTIRLRFEGGGGVHITVAEEESHVSLSTVDVNVQPSGVLVAWVVNGAVRFSFGPGSNVRGLFVDPAIPLAALSHPRPWLPAPLAAPRGLRIERDK